jgi:Flp pilus assembly protein TadG
MPGTGTQRARSAGARARRGSFVVEFLFNLPIWLLMVLGMAEVGELVSGAQHLSLASRVGAKEASQTSMLPDRGDVPAGVLQAVASCLGNAGLSASQVILEHNANGTPAVLISGPGRGDVPSAPPPTDAQYVRVTVVARGSQLTSRFLCRLGLDFSVVVLRESTTFRYAVKGAEKRR